MSIEVERYRPERPDEPSGPNRGMRWFAVLGLVIVFFGMAYLGVKWLASAVNDVIASPDSSTVAPGTPVDFEVLAGTPASQIARDLVSAGVVASAAGFDKEVRDANASDRLQAGTYELETGMDPAAVLAILVAGPPDRTYRLTVIEGLSVGKMLDSISRQTGISFEDLAAALLDGSVASSLMPDPPRQLQDWEGLLFPDTYEFSTDADAAEILALMARTAEERVGAIDWTYLTDRGLTPYDGVIIASLVEREAVLDEDRPLVASVIYNRLDLGMALQFDATVVYALGGLPDGGLTLDDLSIESPYNTYLHTGLPPTPIAGVRIASLEAAAAPAESDYLYFLTTDDTGKFTFTADFDEFLRLQEEAGATS
ncbi:MAG: hypothetical protein A2Z12_00875 [Actinobacteria bacterium RBG_16_68_21]|nr:MAG: hypothetical protein A2Z12_00875 [Actinobacteria bacterium RBG_16_68_21]